ncbi:MAG: hypothetical protein AB7P48_15170, partial [Methylocystis sp.]
MRFSLLFGDIEQREIVTGYASYLATEYFLPPDSEASAVLAPNIANMLSRLDEFSTIDLEVASTILFYEREGLNRFDAIDRTKALKPTKVTDKTLQASAEILSVV